MTPAELGLPERAQATRVRHVAVEDLIAERPDTGFSWSGFQPGHADIVDWIFKITHRIWAERAVGYIYDTYDHACPVYAGADFSRGAEEVVVGTLATLAAFDRDSRFLNVAWSEDADGFYTSHLGVSAVTHIGPNAWGPATGRRARFLTCADCVSRDGRIHTEWLIRDNGALVAGLGFDMFEVAERMARADAASGRTPWYVGLPRRAPGQAQPGPLDRPEGPGIEDRLAHLLHDVLNRRRIDALPRLYAPNVHVHMAGGREIMGRQALGDFWISFLAAFPDAVHSLDHFCWSEETDGIILAARWGIRAHHRGYGPWGPPTGKPVYVLGMSHFRIDESGLIVEEWTLFDELAILRQIHRPSGAPS
ncbi:ester cyclase [Roseomonas sp. CCTCC AB2023176]|uniref:ester cyclase n=1 Tax=Roseomonas sp. CCTCC AB2023176 TaxID=3342640 RepID=UPI0035DDEB85